MIKVPEYSVTSKAARGGSGIAGQRSPKWSPTRFAPTFAQTMDDANQALNEPLSDHSAITVVLPLVRRLRQGQRYEALALTYQAFRFNLKLEKCKTRPTHQFWTA